MSIPKQMLPPVLQRLLRPFQSRNGFRMTAAAAAAAAVALLPGVAPAQEVASAFQPDFIALGQNSVFTIEIEGEPKLDDIQVPVPDGLRLTSSGSSTSTSIQIAGNRRVERRTLHINFVAQPTRAGTFQIPPFPIRANGRSLTVPGATLHVSPPPGSGPAATLDDIYSLEVVPPERPIWVGEDLGMAVRLHLGGSIRLTNILRFGVVGEDFASARPLGEVNRSVDTATGTPRQRFDIPIHLTPLKSGTLPLQVSLIAEMEFPQSQRSRDPFGFPSLFRNTERREIESTPATLEVRPLPQPAMAGFTGGIGRFAARLEHDTAEVRVGEPITVTLTVTGEGNFDRLQAPEFAADLRWRTYEPRADFSAADRTGRRGTKSFVYTLIPLDSAVTATPDLPLAAFDPEAGTYINLPLPNLPVSVAPAPERPITPPAVARTERPSSSPNELLPDTANLGRSYATITPDLTAPAFWARVAAPAPVLALAWIAGWLRRRLGDPAQRRRSAFRRTLRAALDSASRQAQAGDSAAFHHAAAAVLRLLASRALGRAPEALTASEVDRGLEQLALNAGERAAARRLLATADLHRYGGAPPVRSADLANAAAELERIARRHG